MIVRFHWPSLQKRAWLAITALVALLMLPNLLWLYVGKDPDQWANVLLLPMLLLLIFFAVFGKRLWLACLLLAPFSAFAPIEAAHIGAYLHPTNSVTFATLVVTNPREIFEYLGSALIPLLLCIATAFLLAMLAMRWSWQSRISWSHRSRIWLIAVAAAIVPVVMIFSMISAPGDMVMRLHDGIDSLLFLRFPVSSGYPFGLFPRYAQYRREWREMREASALLDAFRFQAHRVAPIQKRQVYVLVIGESSRRNNWQLFGYERTTNPELIQVENLVPIPDMVSSWPSSLLAIPMILTRKPIANHGLGWNEASILRAMTEAGFGTYWISNQLPIGQFDSPISTYAYEAQHTIFLNPTSWADSGSYDEVLLQPLRDALKSSDGDLFVVLHMMGSHLYYDLRYPASFKHFRPALSDREGIYYDRARNSYDNSILYTDRVLASTISILRESDAISALFFESDHGENLPTRTCLMSGHGYGTRYDFQIPALFWYSDAYATAFPARLAALRKNADQRVQSRSTFESMIDMAGIDFPGHDQSASLFSPQWRFSPRIVSDLKLKQVDIDNAVFEEACQTVLPREH